MEFRRCVVALLMLLLAAALHAQPVLFTDLAKHSEHGTVKISPDGSYLATTNVVKGQAVLALIRLSDKTESTVRPRDGNDVVNYWWASPGRVLYTVGLRDSQFEEPYSLGELFAVDVDGGHPKMLYGFRKANTAAPDRGWATFIGGIANDPVHVLVEITPWEKQYPHNLLPIVYRMDVRDGRKEEVVAAPMEDASFVADHQGRIRFAYAEDADERMQVSVLQADGKSWLSLPKISAQRAYPLGFNADDSVAYFDCPQAPGVSGICSWDAKTHGLTPIWTHPEVEADGLLRGLARDSIIGISFTDGRPAVALLDNQSTDAKALMLLMKQFPGESVRFVSGTRDGRLSIVLVEADTDPGSFYLFDHRAHKLTLLLSRAPWIDPTKMASKQPFEFAARDGLKLRGYISFPPDRQDGKNLPMVVFVHGGPYGISDDWDYDPDVQAMTTRGYMVLQVNFRGSGGRGRDFTHAGWLQWGGKMQDDVTDATHWAVTRGLADPQRICIFGASYGGYAALEGAVKEPGLYKCAIGYAGIYDLKLMFKRGDIPQSKSGKNYLKQVLGEDMNLLAQHSPVNQLDALKARVMLIVGGDDTRAPPKHSLELRQALRKHQMDPVWLFKPHEGHGFRQEANNVELYTQLMQFLGATIGPGMPSVGGGTATKAAAH
ncbi:prolyl oligopeptidase family serine peptidase [Rhodanobacter sp. T12-5]|uniref:alpha/beta hydrolase family protein n=1 Tax=Rhodanobacter sp. T12-5 TaxID=2024611 RepID=UPI0011EF3B7D|nr:prolyl oligopeptidase family serine peptidase [Rhodanobacter sp. T12-5]KAA0070646.1 S9 family peptidase [Rhodanobacter sp. T12-5]